MLTYNKIVDGCFNYCVFSFNTRELLKEEVYFCFFYKKIKKNFKNESYKEVCVDSCTQRSLNSHTRLSRHFAAIQLKKMEDANKEAEKMQQQQQLANTDTNINQ